MQVQNEKPLNATHAAEDLKRLAFSACASSANNHEFCFFYMLYRRKETHVEVMMVVERR
jgi:hypothetical protein